MKKRISAAMLAAIITLTLAGCKNNNASDNNSSDSNAASDTSSVVSDSTDSTSDSNDSTSDSNDSTDVSDQNSGETGDSTSDAGNGGVDNSGLEYPDTKAGRMVKAALATDAWGAMDLAMDQEYVNALFSEKFVLDNMEEYCFTSSLMSTQLLKVAVFKPKAGTEEDFKTAIDEYLAYAKEGAAFYPAQEESAAGAVSGTTDDGYMYLVVHQNGADIANALVAAE